MDHSGMWKSDDDESNLLESVVNWAPNEELSRKSSSSPATSISTTTTTNICSPPIVAVVTTNSSLISAPIPPPSPFSELFPHELLQSSGLDGFLGGEHFDEEIGGGDLNHSTAATTTTAKSDRNGTDFDNGSRNTAAEFAYGSSSFATPQPPRPPPPAPVQHRCSLCKFATDDRRLLMCHKRSQHAGEKTFSCPDCSAKFTRLYTMKKHQQLKHGGGGGGSVATTTSTSTLVPLPKICPWPNCKYSTRNPNSMQLHKRTHQQTYFCKECNTRYSRRQSLLGHLTKHHGSNAALIGMRPTTGNSLMDDQTCLQSPPPPSSTVVGSTNIDRRSIEPPPVIAFKHPSLSAVSTAVGFTSTVSTASGAIPSKLVRGSTNSSATNGSTSDRSNPATAASPSKSKLSSTKSTIILSKSMSQTPRFIPICSKPRMVAGKFTDLASNAAAAIPTSATMMDSHSIENSVGVANSIVAPQPSSKTVGLSPSKSNGIIASGSGSNSVKMAMNSSRIDQILDRNLQASTTADNNDQPPASSIDFILSNVVSASNSESNIGRSDSDEGKHDDQSMEIEEEHDGTKSYTCEKCDFITNSIKKLYAHKKISAHNQQRTRNCAVAKKLIPKGASAASSLLSTAASRRPVRHRTKAIRFDSLISSTSTIAAAPGRNKTAIKGGGKRRNHRAAVRGIKKNEFQCKLCEFRTSRKRIFVAHSKSHRSGDDSPEMPTSGNAEIPASSNQRPVSSTATTSTSKQRIESPNRGGFSSITIGQSNTNHNLSPNGVNYEKASQQNGGSGSISSYSSNGSVGNEFAGGFDFGRFYVYDRSRAAPIGTATNGGPFGHPMIDHGIGDYRSMPNDQYSVGRIDNQLNPFQQAIGRAIGMDHTSPPSSLDRGIFAADGFDQPAMDRSFPDHILLDPGSSAINHDYHHHPPSIDHHQRSSAPHRLITLDLHGDDRDGSSEMQSIMGNLQTANSSLIRLLGRRERELRNLRSNVIDLLRLLLPDHAVFDRALNLEHADRLVMETVRRVASEMGGGGISDGSDR